MLAYVIRVHVERPPKTAFQILTAPDLAASWAPGVLRLESVTPAPLTEGSVLREYRRLPAGRDVQSELTVTSLEAPKRLVIESRLGDVTTTWTYELAEEERGASVVLTCRVDAAPPAARTARMLGRVLKRQDKKLLKSFKRVVEAQP